MSTPSSLKVRARVILARARIDELSTQYRIGGAGVKRKITNLKPADVEKIKALLSQIGEPENRHYMVIEKCSQDAKELEYFLQLANDYALVRREDKETAQPEDCPGSKPEVNLICGSDIDMVEVSRRHLAAMKLAQEVIKRCQKKIY